MAKTVHSKMESNLQQIDEMTRWGGEGVKCCLLVGGSGAQTDIIEVKHVVLLDQLS